MQATRLPPQKLLRSRGGQPGLAPEAYRLPWCSESESASGGSRVGCGLWNLQAIRLPPPHKTADLFRRGRRGNDGCGRWRQLTNSSGLQQYAAPRSPLLRPSSKNSLSPVRVASTLAFIAAADRVSLHARRSVDQEQRPHFQSRHAAHAFCPRVRLRSNNVALRRAGL